MSEVESAGNPGLPRQVEGYGIGCIDDVRPRALAKVGDFVLDLDRLQVTGHLASLNLAEDLFKETTLNRFMSLRNAQAGRRAADRDHCGWSTRRRVCSHSAR